MQNTNNVVFIKNTQKKALDSHDISGEREKDFNGRDWVYQND